MFASIGELVLIPADEEDGKIGQGLVDLRRMRRVAEDGLCSALPLRNILDESEAPRQGCLVSVDLVVEKITHTNQTRHRSHSYRESIEQPQLRQSVLISIIEHTQNHTDGATMRGQSAFPCLEDFKRMGKIIIGIVEEAMPKARSNYRANKGSKEKVIDTLGIEPLTSIDPLHDLDADKKAHDEHQGIPAQGKPANLKDDRMGSPSNF